MTDKDIKTYYINDNGGRPFKVDIIGKKVTISGTYVENEKIYTEIVTYKPKQIFIGISEKNKMSEFGLGYGPNFDGNSILLYMNKNTYIFIGMYIYSFQALNTITTFVSSVGNNDVPYPYAIDNKGYIYLLIEDVIMKPNDELKQYLSDKLNDAYFYYYDKHDIIKNKFENIKEFYIGKTKYNLTYKSNPKNNYMRFIKYFDKYGISIVDKDNNRIQLDKKSYVALIKRFGKQQGFKKLHKLMIHKRVIDCKNADLICKLPNH